MGVNVVCWRWKSPRTYRSIFTADTVNVLRRMVARHYHEPHEFICVTDDPSGIDNGIRIVPLWDEFANIPNPSGRHNPSCYRRLKSFSVEAREWFGERFVSIDLDTVIVGDITPLLSRSEEFVIWGETNPKSFYNGSMFMMTAGARRQVYDDFNPITSPRQAHAAGRFGSDQGWLSYKLGLGEATWGKQDGIYSYRVHIEPSGNRLPDNARMVMFHGKTDPWCWRGQSIPWVQEHYR